MRTCPVCHANRVNLSALVAAAFRSSSRCSACGAGLKFNWVSDVIVSLAFAAGLGAGLVFESVLAGVIVAATGWAAVLYSPLVPVATDPITLRRQLRASRQSRDQ